MKKIHNKNGEIHEKNPQKIVGKFVTKFLKKLHTTKFMKKIHKKKWGNSPLLKKTKFTQRKIKKKP